jgi:hypothetical protein
MKIKLVTFLFAASVLFGTACSDPGTGAYVMNTKAELTKITIGGITVPGNSQNLEGNRVEVKIPNPIDSLVWNSEDMINEEEYATMTLLRDGDFTGARINAVTSKSARVAYGIGDQYNRPTYFVDYRVPATFSPNDFLYIRVTSEDTLLTNYYRFYVRVFNAVTHLDALFIGDKKAEVAEGGENWELASDGGVVSVTTLDSKDHGKLRAVGFSSTSTFQFARVAKGGTAAPVFKTLPENRVQEGFNEADPPVPIYVTYFNFTEFGDFKDDDTLYVKVIAQNGVDSDVYKFWVRVGHIATVKNLYMVDGTTKLEVMGKGVPNTGGPASGANEWGETNKWGDVRAGSFQTADQPTLGYNIDVVLDDPVGTYEYFLLANIGANLPVFNGKPGIMLFNNTNALAIKVTSENGSIMYYKIKVDLLAARFLEQPKSTVYYYFKDPATVHPINENDPEKDWIFIDYASPTTFVSDGDPGGSKPIAPLTFRLDRDIPGATYQWYEANSWYGGYGFDAEGNIGYIDEKEALVWEPKFNPAFGYPNPPYNQYHAQQFDEKKNPSLFNGGNQGPPHYVLPGIEIPGETGLTYTPKITYRPFITGFSSESHYYWVKITAPNGRELTSGRATIVSERDNRKKHYFIDTNNDYKSKETKVIGGVTYYYPLPFKNVIPFAKRYDYFRIPLTFPALKSEANPNGFDIMDYSVMTAQAKFYLADGTDWIENWTNGNLAFEDNTEKEPATPYSKDVPAPFVLYYNLTNQNATYMMDGDSKEPQGADLNKIPTHVVISPSGDHTKGANKDGYPPLGPDGRAAPSIVGTDLQGWFCGYIELTELRFEGPPRGGE